MSDQLIEQSTCRFPGCGRPPAEWAGTGRPPEYCDDPEHNAGSAWRAKQKTKSGGVPAATVETLPVDAARTRAAALLAQVTDVGELLVQQLGTLVVELRTVGDPDAAEAEIETVTSEAAEQMAAATARANRAEKARREAEADKAEADAAAAEASELAATKEAELVTLRQELTDRGDALDQVTRDFVEERAAAEIRDQEAQAQLVNVRVQVTDLEERLGESEGNRETAAAQANAAGAAQAAAEERARGAIANAEVEAGRATRAEATTEEVRKQLEKARTDLDVLRGQNSTLSEQLAVANAAKAAAVADVAREKSVGEQRVTDLRATYERQDSALRTELTDLKKEERAQRTRADRAEAKLAPADSKPAV